MKKTAMATMVGLICVVSSSAAYATTANDESTPLNMIAADPFFADSKIKVTLRNIWKYLKSEDRGDEKTIAQAWGQGLAIDYQSGYFYDVIGFDATYYGGIKLAASDQFSSRAVLYNNNGEAEGYNKLGQRYVKLKLDLDAIRFDVKGGWQVMKNTGVLTSSTRLSLNSYQGWSGKVTVGDVYADLVYVTITSRRDSPNKVRFTDASGKEIDHVFTGGITYKDKTTSVAYFYGDASDYVKQHGLEASFKPLPKLTVNTQIYGQIADDKQAMMSISDSKRPFDDKAWHYAANVKWTEPTWSVKVGLAYTDANKDDGLGYYSRNIIGNSRGRFNSTAYADVDYTRDGEKYLSIDYNNKLSEDYSAGIRGMYGQLSYKGNHINSNGVTLYNIWTPSAIKNLHIYADVGYGWHYKNDNRRPLLDQNGDFQRAHSLSGSATITYFFNLL